MKILVTVHALVAGAAMLTACGQKSGLFLPGTPESIGRATLPQTLKLWPKNDVRDTSAEPSAPNDPMTESAAEPSGTTRNAPKPYSSMNSPVAPVAPAK